MMDILKLILISRKPKLLRLARYVSCFIVFIEALPQTKDIKTFNKPIVLEQKIFLHFYRAVTVVSTKN